MKDVAMSEANMLEITCPSCGWVNLRTPTALQVKPGKRRPKRIQGQCESCRTGLIFVGPIGDQPAKAIRTGSFTLIELLVVVCIIGILIALLMPAVSRLPEPARRRMHCSTNLRSIGLALESYHANHGCYPPAYIADENGRPMHSWRVLILPELGYTNIYNQYNFDEPWDGPNNRRLARFMPSTYKCYADLRVQSQHHLTTYLAITGEGTAFDGAECITSADVTDDPSQTIIVVETATEPVNWMEPTDITASTFYAGLANTPDDEDVHHGSGLNALAVGGIVHYLPRDETTDAEFRAMTTIAGGEETSE